MLNPRPSASAYLTTKMFSGDDPLSALKFCVNVSANWYTPELMTLSARFFAAWQASSGPATVIPKHELYAVGLMAPAPGPSFLYTRALMYRLASSASTAPRVTRPTLGEP